MASPYSGLTEAELLGIKSNLLKILGGKRFQSTSVTGFTGTRRIDSLQEARVELVLVNQALAAINPDEYGGGRVSRTFIKAV